jgi:hypothetical protein
MLIKRLIFFQIANDSALKQFIRRSYGPYPVIWFASAFVQCAIFTFLYKHYPKYFVYLAIALIAGDTALGYLSKWRRNPPH